ncbi:MAG: hypothetical protein KKH98_06960 [Spirochaetes bacterium]|nr:hypothetical protein [Spirochaetota bacterium]
MKTLLSLIFLFGLSPCLLFSADNIKMIASFDGSLENTFQGLYNRVLKVPSIANAYQDPDVFYGKAGRSLKIKAHREEEGWCGIWMHLFRTKDELEKKPIKFYDPTAEGYKYLSFMVKGKKGGELFQVGAADKKRVESEDPLLIGLITDYLKKGITRDWQEVVIPFDMIDIDLTTFGLLLFDFTEPGDHTVYIDNICFKSAKNDKLNYSGKPFRNKSNIKKVQNAMWVWLVNDILFKENGARDLFAFCKKRNINELFLQLLYEFKGKKKDNSFTCIVKQKDAFRKFLKEAHGKKIKVHVLDGYPDWVMRERHHEPLALAQAVCDYNKEVEPIERFDGIHLDNEPYLMIAFKSPFRKRIYREYIELNDKLTELIHKNSDMVFGIDIPFFLEQPFETTGEIELIEYKGKKQATSYHLLDIVDNIGIMGYRDFAYGADGAIYHCRDEINYAEKVNKPVYIGVEVFKYPLITVYLIAGFPKKEFYRRLQKEASDMAFISRIEDFRIQTFDDGHNVHIGIEVPENYKDMEKVKNSVRKLAGRFGINEYKKKSTIIDESLENAEFGIPKDVEWENFIPMEYRYEDSREFYRGFKATLIMLPKITYAEESLKYLNEELKWIQYEFSDKRSFYGFAIHYYDVFRKMK